MQVGMQVLKKSFLRKKCKGGKLDPQWLGSYRIANDLGKGFYALSDLNSEDIVTKRINGAHLKAYFTSPLSKCSSLYTNLHSHFTYSTCVSFRGDDDNFLNTRFWSAEYTSYRYSLISVTVSNTNDDNRIVDENGAFQLPQAPMLPSSESANVCDSSKNYFKFFKNTCTTKMRSIFEMHSVSLWLLYLHTMQPLILQKLVSCTHLYDHTLATLMTRYKPLIYNYLKLCMYVYFLVYIFV